MLSLPDEKHTAKMTNIVGTRVGKEYHLCDIMNLEMEAIRGQIFKGMQKGGHGKAHCKGRRPGV